MIDVGRAGNGLPFGSMMRFQCVLLVFPLIALLRCCGALAPSAAAAAALQWLPQAPLRALHLVGGMGKMF